MPIKFAYDIILFDTIPEAVLATGMGFATVIGVVYFLHNASREDIYAKRAAGKLKMLTTQLNDINIETSYDLLLQSELYEKKYKIEFNKKRLPRLLESKYIMVPVNNYNNAKEISILQEHVVGSKEYVLSIGSPSKEFKLAHQGA